MSSKGRKEYADRAVKIKYPNNEAYTKAVEDMAEQKEVMSMVGIVICTLLVCITTATINIWISRVIYRMQNLRN